VYTSIRVGAGEARGCGEDAIRVVAFWKGDRASWGVYKAVRTFRTGSVEAVIERVHERARAAYGACNEHVKTGRCPICKHLCGGAGVGHA
jgi:hypothetical protein